MRLEFRERFPRHRLQRKPLVSDPSMHHYTCVTHVPWRMSGSLTHSVGENVSGIPGAYATRNFTYLSRGPCQHMSRAHIMIWLHCTSIYTDILEFQKHQCAVHFMERFFKEHICYKLRTVIDDEILKIWSSQDHLSSRPILLFHSYLHPLKIYYSNIATLWYRSIALTHGQSQIDTW